MAEKVALTGGDDALTLATTGLSLAWVCGAHDSAAAYGSTAILLNPDLAAVWIQCGGMSKFSGNHALAIEQFTRAKQISPVGVELSFAHGYTGLPLLFVERFEEAAACGSHAAAHMPNWLVGHLVCSAAHAFLGNKDKARQSLAIVKLLNPTLRCSYLRRSFSCARPQDGAKLAEGLRIAGLRD